MSKVAQHPTKSIYSGPTLADPQAQAWLDDVGAIPPAGIAFCASPEDYAALTMAWPAGYIAAPAVICAPPIEIHTLAKRAATCAATSGRYTRITGVGLPSDLGDLASQMVEVYDLKPVGPIYAAHKDHDGGKIVRDAWALERRAIVRPVELMPDLGVKKHQFLRTDLGNAERIVHHFGNQIKYMEDRKAWYVFDGRRWVSGRVSVENAAKTVGRKIIDAEREATADDGERGALAKWSAGSESAARCAAMLRHAQSDPTVVTSASDFDKAPMTMNVLNGTIDLQSGMLMEHRAQDRMTMMAPVFFDEKATCPTWDDCVKTWTGGNRNIADYLRRVAGYCLTGSVVEQALFIFFGDGQNGKSTFVNTLMSIMGEYSSSAAIGLLTEKGDKSSASAQAGIAALRGSRLVVATENDDSDYLAEGTVKTLTSEESIKAAFKFENPTDFKPTHKLIWTLNHKPQIRQMDAGIWRRPKLIPFTVTIPNDKRDCHLAAKLSAELSGILNWCIRGCLEWQRSGLADPPEIEREKDQHRLDMDLIGGFIADTFIKHPDVKPGARDGTKPQLDQDWGHVGIALMTTLYEDWCNAHGHKPVGGRRLVADLARVGIMKRKRASGWFWEGIAWKDEKTDAFFDSLMAKIDSLPTGAYKADIVKRFSVSLFDRSELDRIHSELSAEQPTLLT